jgi:hypothetical protein
MATGFVTGDGLGEPVLAARRAAYKQEAEGRHQASHFR